MIDAADRPSHSATPAAGVTQIRSFSAALPLPGFCRSFTSQQAPLLQPNRMIKRLALGGKQADRLARSASSDVTTCHTIYAA